MPTHDAATVRADVEGPLLAVGTTRVFGIVADAAVDRLAVVALAVGLLGIDLERPNEHVLVAPLIGQVDRDAERLLALGADAHRHKRFFCQFSHII